MGVSIETIQKSPYFMVDQEPISHTIMGANLVIPTLHHMTYLSFLVP